MKKHKANTITGNSKHYNSKGSYYSYGNRANFGLINLSSVSQYADKGKRMQDTINGIVLEELSQNEQELGILSLTKYIPLLPM